MALLLMPATVFCQQLKKEVSFGKVTKEELLNNTCDFDKDAEALVLLDYGKMYLDISGPQIYQELQVHTRIKILKESGLKRADVKLSYKHYLNAQQINNITANTYNLDAAGNIVVSKLDKKSIYETKLSAKRTQESFSMPDVKVGSIIEYKYTFRGYNGRHWIIQQDIPVKLSSYEVNFPGIIELHTRSFTTLPLVKKDESTGIRTIARYQMENVPGIKEEEYVTCKSDYIERIECWPVAYTLEGRRHPLIGTWTSVAKDMLDDADFGMQLKKEIPRTADLDAALAKISDPFQKMVTIHNYVRSNMKWDGVENFWALSGVKNAWKEKSGTSGEINLILINLLRDAGLKVDPIMVSTHDNGRMNMSFPDIYQFNEVLAYVEIDGKFYVLDGTDKYTPSGMIPRNVMATEGFVLDPSSETSFRITQLWDDSHVDKNVVVFQAAIDAAGVMKGHATITSRDYGRTRRAPRLKNREEFVTQFISKKDEYAVDGFTLKNEEVDSLPLIQDFDFNGNVKGSGEYSYFSTNMFSGLGPNPFIADQRVADVFFGTNQSYQVIASIKIPEGYEFEELPKNMRMTLEDNSLSVTRMFLAQGNMLSSRITLEFKRPYYSPEEYADLKEFYKKMYSLLDEQIVIKKKA
jgi:hypothetical protein